MGTIKIIMYILIIIAILYAVWLVVSSYKRTKAFFEKKIPPLTNFHTHTTYCDGECSAQEMLEAAIAQNMEAIGFSVHSHLDSEPDWTIDKNEMQLYVGELSNMQGDYEPKIRVLIGIEQDYWSREEDCDIEGIEYKIGSVHSLIEEDTTWSSVDYKPENTATCRDKYFDGDIYKMVERYFELVGDIYERTHCNIVGHFDLIAKSRFGTAKAKGEKLEPGWALDKNGNPTTDPDEGIQGFVLPMAGFKGYGIAMMIDIMSGFLSGAGYLNTVGKFYSQTGNCMNVGHMITAFNPELIYDGNYLSDADGYIEKLKASKSVGDKEIVIPGDDRKKNRESAVLNGIALTDDVVEKLEHLFGEKLQKKVREII